MKSAHVQCIFQRVCGRCEQIYANVRHFPSELARSKRVSIAWLALHGMTPLTVRQSVGFVLRKVKMWVVPRKIMIFRPNSRKRIGIFYVFTHKWGNPHLCVPPASQAKLPPRGALNDRGISLVATSDQRYARWIGASFLEKAWQKL